MIIEDFRTPEFLVPVKTEQSYLLLTEATRKIIPVHKGYVWL
jgi:hypothetical protein